MTKIILIGAQLSGNLGGPSLVSSTMKVLGNSIPEAEFTLLSPSPADSKLSETYGIKIVRKKERKSLLGRFLGAILDLGKYKGADLVVDIWGLGLGEGLMLLLVRRLLNKPVIKYTADMGPFRRKVDRFFIRFYLNNISLVLVRSKTTKKHLFELGITTPIHVCPDTAFVLECLPSRKSQTLHREKSRKKILVGISVSHIADRREHKKDEYVTTMAKIADYLIKKMNAFVVLIPNEIFPNRYDDEYVARKIHEKVSNKPNVMLLTEEYSASELKGIIGECDLFIGARYHSIVAATSMLIPTVAISWHYKYHEVMDLMGQEEYVCDLRRFNFAELRRKVDSLWANRERIRAEIASKLPSIKESVLLGGKMVKEVLDAKKGP